MTLILTGSDVAGLLETKEMPWIAYQAATAHGRGLAVDLLA